MPAATTAAIKVEVFAKDLANICYIYTNSHVSASVVDLTFVEPQTHPNVRTKAREAGKSVVSSISYIGALGAGLLSFLSPCVLPLVPPYLCFLAGISLEDLTRAEKASRWQPNWRVVALAFAFVLGFATVFVALGASASVLGKVVTAHFDTLAIIAGLLIILLGLHFLGVFRIGMLFREARFQSASKPAGFVGAYLVGLAFAFGWTPCVGPVLATILMVAGVEASAARGALLLGAYALGIGIPFLLASLFSGVFMRVMQQMRGHMAAIEKVIGGALVLTGVLFLTGGMPRVAGWLLETFPTFGSVG